MKDFERSDPAINLRAVGLKGQVLKDLKVRRQKKLGSGSPFDGIESDEDYLGEVTPSLWSRTESNHLIYLNQNT